MFKVCVLNVLGVFGCLSKLIPHIFPNLNGYAFIAWVAEAGRVIGNMDWGRGKSQSRKICYVPHGKLFSRQVKGTSMISMAVSECDTTHEMTTTQLQHYCLVAAAASPGLAHNLASSAVEEDCCLELPDWSCESSLAASSMSLIFWRSSFPPAAVSVSPLSPLTIQCCRKPVTWRCPALSASHSGVWPHLQGR